MGKSMQSGMAAKIAAADVDPFALQKPPVLARRLPRPMLIWLLTGLLAYLVGLIALIPARMVLSERDNLRVGGTIWNGEAVLASTVRIDWQFAPIRTLTRMGFGVDFHVSGGGTDLAGSVTTAGGMMRFDDVSGQMDDTLLAAFAPNLPFTCRFLADVAIDHLVLGGSAQQAKGTWRMSPATCSPKAVAAPPVQFPATRAEFAPRQNGSSGALMTLAGREHLAEFRLSPRGALSIWPTAIATQKAPFLAGLRYDTTID